MKRYKWMIILLNLAALLIFFNYSIVKKEAILARGQLVFLELAPIDPRSMMQGDYMQLRYTISQSETDESKIDKRGFCVVTLDSNKIASKVRYQTGSKPLADNEYLIEYTKASFRGINIGAESYFFEEGTGSKYDSAKYGGIRIDEKGNSILTGLYNKALQKL